MKKKVIFLCLSVLLCTSTFAFANLNDMQWLEKRSKTIMDFCNNHKCPASPLETNVNNVVSPVNKEIDSIQLPHSRQIQRRGTSIKTS